MKILKNFSKVWSTKFRENPSAECRPFE